MSPRYTGRSAMCRYSPRASGDEPSMLSANHVTDLFAPRERG